MKGTFPATKICKFKSFQAKSSEARDRGTIQLTDRCHFTVCCHDFWLLCSYFYQDRLL